MGYVRVGCCHTTDTTSGKGTTKGTAIEARSIANVDYGRTRADAAARVRDFLDGFFAVDPTTFCARLRVVPNLDFVGEPRPDRSRSDPHRHDNPRERRVCEVVHL